MATKATSPSEVTREGCGLQLNGKTAKLLKSQNEGNYTIMHWRRGDLTTVLQVVKGGRLRRENAVDLRPEKRV